MPKITYLKEFEGKLWARLEFDHPIADMPVHIITDREIEEIKKEERQKVWDEIKEATRAEYNEDEF